MYGPLLVDNGRVRGIIAISTTLDIGSHYFRVRHSYGGDTYAATMRAIASITLATSCICVPDQRS